MVRSGTQCFYYQREVALWKLSIFKQTHSTSPYMRKLIKSENSELQFEYH